jgi:hypothetical protein
VLAWLALAAVDFLLIPGAEHWTMLAVRGVVLVLLVICAALILQRRFAPLMVPLSIACILAVGIGAALVVGTPTASTMATRTKACYWSAWPPTSWSACVSPKPWPRPC